MTWRDFSIYAIAKERNDLLQAAMTREIVFSIYESAGKVFKEPKKEKLWPLPTDEIAEKLPPPSKERIERLMKLLQQPQAQA